MKKLLLILLVMVFTMAGCSSGVPQAEYDQLKQEYETVSKELEELKEEYDSIYSEWNVLKAEKAKEDEEKENEKKLNEEKQNLVTPPVQTDAQYNLDWDKINTEIKKELTDPEYFDYVLDVAVVFDSSTSRISLMAAVSDSVDTDVVLDFADTFLRRVNLSAMTQDASISSGSKDSYGGLYDKYNISIGIAPISKLEDQSKWFVFDAIAKGVQTKHTIKLQRAYR